VTRGSTPGEAVALVCATAARAAVSVRAVAARVVVDCSTARGRALATGVVVRVAGGAAPLRASTRTAPPPPSVRPTPVTVTPGGVVPTVPAASDASDAARAGDTGTETGT
jgi:hypothetical protein